MRESSPHSLDALLEEVAAPLGFEVICWEWVGQGKYRVLRLFLDTLPGPEGEEHANQEPTRALDQSGQGPARSGVSLEDCATVSRMVGLRLEAAEEEPEWAATAAQFKAPYTLEVSSPGIERPLTKIEHFARFAGQKAMVRCDRDLRPGEARKKFCGALLGVATQGPEASIRLMDEELNEEVEIPISAVRKAHLVYEGRI